MNDHLERPVWVSHLNRFGPAVGGEEGLIPLDAAELEMPVN